MRRKMNENSIIPYISSFDKLQRRRKMNENSMTCHFMQMVRPKLIFKVDVITINYFLDNGCLLFPLRPCRV